MCENLNDKLEVKYCGKFGIKFRVNSNEKCSSFWVIQERAFHSCKNDCLELTIQWGNSEQWPSLRNCLFLNYIFRFWQQEQSTAEIFTNQVLQLMAQSSDKQYCDNDIPILKPRVPPPIIIWVAMFTFKKEKNACVASAT